LDQDRYALCSIAGVFYGSLIEDDDKADLLGLCDERNIGHAEVQVNSGSGLSNCHAVSNNVTLSNRTKLPSVGWINLGAGSLQGWTHQGERKCQICEEPDLNDHCDPFGLPGFLEDHIIDPQASGGIHDPNNTALLCPSCHKRLHLDIGFTAKHRDGLRSKNRNNR
jgi:hypothetical protein